MNTYYTKFLHTIFWAAKCLIIAFGMQSLIMGHDSFEQIETDLRAVQEKAIADIYKSFPLIPQTEWQYVRKDIDFAIKETRKLLLENPEKQYHFQPKLEKDFKYNDFKPFEYNEKEHNNQSPRYFLNLKKELSLNRFELCARIWTSARGIKQETISVKSFSDPNYQVSAYAKSGDSQYQRIDNGRWNLMSISKQQNIEINLPSWDNEYFKFSSDKAYAMRQMNTINHELTHLIEAHGIMHGILERIVKQYYPNTNLKNHPQFINLQRSHELMATVVPLMLSLPNALKENLNFPAPSTIHPSGADLKPWLHRIISCYKHYYGKINHPNNDIEFFIKDIKCFVRPALEKFLKLDLIKEIESMQNIRIVFQ